MNIKPVNMIIKTSSVWLFFFFAISFFAVSAYGQKGVLIGADPSSKAEYFKAGFGIYPNFTNARIGFRSNLSKKWTFDSKFGFNFSTVPLFNVELDVLNRHYRNDFIAFYNGYGLTLDGLTPGLIFPLGFEVRPFKEAKNIMVVVESSPKLTLSFAAGYNVSLMGNVGIILFRPKKTK